VFVEIDSQKEARFVLKHRIKAHNERKSMILDSGVEMLINHNILGH